MKSWPKIDGALADYVDANWLRESPLKRRLREETAKLPQAGMQISAHQGQQIAWLARAIGARRAVEVGTFTGYSSLCLAEALPADGKLWCCDVSEQWTAIARRYWKEAGVESRIELTIAPALKTLDGLLAQGLAGQLDLAFIDANKDGYDAYYERCLRLVRPRRHRADRQRAVGRLGRQPRRQGRRHPGDPRAQCQAQGRRARRSRPLRRGRRDDLRAETVGRITSETKPPHPEEHRPSTALGAGSAMRLARGNPRCGGQPVMPLPTLRDAPCGRSSG